MKRIRAPGSGRRFGAFVSVCAGLGAAPVLAQTPAAVPGSPAAAPVSESLAVNLLELLVKQGVISRTAADRLLEQAQQETAQARALAAAAATPAAGAVVSAAPASPAGVPASTAVASAGPGLPPPAPGVLRVPYVPQVVRNEIRDEVKAEVMQQAKAEGWAQPGALPDWLGKVRISGDVRFRSEYDLYSKNNTNEQIDFATFNSSGPTDINPDTNPNGLPFLNTRVSRYNNLFIRARLAFDSTLADNFGASIRLATGNTNGPTSTTALLSGGFAKNNIWLDRAYVWFKPADWLTLAGGRMPNPFQSTDLLYSDDLNFDGVDGRFAVRPWDDLGLSLVGGAFPLGYQSANFPADSSTKQPQNVSWLFAAQAGADWKADPVDWKTAAAFYDFSDVRGQISQPCAIYAGLKQCSTDTTTPPYLGQGNTLFFIRDILPNPSSPLDYAQPQLLGLRFGYQLANIDSVFDYALSTDEHLIITADYVRNIAYNGKDICRNAPNGLPVNNLIPSALGNTDPCDTPTAGDSKAGFKSGPNAWLVKALYGNPDPTRFGQWNISVGYRYIEPDALLDGYNSVDFHLGGANAQGYTLMATLGLYTNAYLQLRWFSANQVYGPPLAIDVGQVDLHVRF